MTNTTKKPTVSLDQFVTGLTFTDDLVKATQGSFDPVSDDDRKTAGYHYDGSYHIVRSDDDHNKFWTYYANDDIVGDFTTVAAWLYRQLASQGHFDDQST